MSRQEKRYLEYGIALILSACIAIVRILFYPYSTEIVGFVNRGGFMVGFCAGAALMVGIFYIESYIKERWKRVHQSKEPSL